MRGFLRRLLAVRMSVPSGDIVRVVSDRDSVRVYLPRRRRDKHLNRHMAAFLTQCGYTCDVSNDAYVWVSQLGCATSVPEVEMSLSQWWYLTRGG